MKRYVVGFAFTKNLSEVLLIEKQKPEWQKGCLNGIGGKIELNESPMQAMIRETEEEAGIYVQWNEKGFMSGINNDSSGFECYIFYAYDDRVYEYKQMESEILRLMSPSSIRGLKVISNLNFLIPYGTCKDGSEYLTLKYR